MRKKSAKLDCRSGLVRQLMSVVRSNKALPRPVSLNEVAEGMRNLLVRLIGENIELKLRLDPALGLVKMDPVQARQILLNLVLNARDALPDGGNISVETGNCKMQILSDKGAAPKRQACRARVSWSSSNGGLIHVQSEVRRGTRINILLPIMPESAPDSVSDTSIHPTHNGEVLSFQSEETTP